MTKLYILILCLAFTDGDPDDGFSEDDCRSSSNDSLISAEYFKMVLDELEVKAVEDSTMKVYMVAWHAINNFYCRLDNKPKPWQQRMALFIAFMIKKRFEKSTIKTYIAGIKYVLRNILHIDVDDNSFRFTALIKAARYKNNKVNIRMPIKLGLLNRILEETTNIKRLRNQPYLVALYRAMFAAAYYGLLRVGEMTGQHAVTAKNVHVAKNKHKVQLRLWTSKTLKWGNWPHDIKIDGLHDCKKCYPEFKGKSSHDYCPVHILAQYNEMRETTTGDKRFFIFKSGISVSGHAFRRTLKEALTQVGLRDALSRYNGHSLRSGRACDLWKLGFSLADIRYIGRWKSNCVFKYLK